MRKPRRSRKPRGLIAASVLALCAAVLVPSPAQAAQPPATPSAVDVARGDGTLTASWLAVTGADRYHVTYSTDGKKSWSLAALSHPDASITFDADNAKTYVVGVRAGNANGWGGWQNSPAAGPWTPPPAPATPSSVSVTRSDGTLTASWPAVAGATAYHVTYSSDGGASWSLAALSHPQNSIDIGGADNSSTYIVGVRARNVGGASGWRNSPAAGPYVPPPPPLPARPTGLTATAGDSSVTLTWDDPADSTITGYEYQSRQAPPAPGWGDWTAVAGNVTTVTVTGLTNGTEYRFKLRAVNAGGAGKPSGPPWYVAATPTLTAPTGITVTVNVNVMTVSWNAVSGADGYDVRTKTGSADWVSAASNVAGTEASVTILEPPDYIGVRARNANSVSAWTDVSRLPPPDIFGSPSAGAGAQSQGAGAFAAQSQGGQAQNTLAAPTNVKVERHNGGDRFSWTTKETLTVKWDAVTGATGYRVACSWYIGFNSWNKCGKDSSDNWQVYGTSAGTTGVTIQYIDGSTTDANTGAWVRLPAADDYAVTVQAVKDGTPGNWSAAFDAYPAFPIYLMRNWHPGFGIVEQYQSLDASVRTQTGFTLAWTHPYRAAGFVAECVEVVNGQHSGSWTTCKKDDNVFSEKTVNGTAVTTSQAHLYGTTANDRVITGITIDDLDIDTTGTQALSPLKHYDVRVRTLNPSGQSAITYPPWSITAPYSTSKLISSNVGATSATLTIYDHTGNWWYEGRPLTTTVFGTCTQVTGSTSVTLSTLTAATQHEYRAYSASGCADANLLAIASFKTTLSGQTVSLAMTNLTWNTARATLSGHTGSWWYKIGTRSGGAGSCTAGPPALILNLSSLTGGTAHTLNAYSDSTCATQIAVANFQTLPGPALTASNIKATSATLTLADHSGDWWHQGTERGATQSSCTKASGATVDLTGLTAGKPYTWGAFSASTCATGALLDSVSFTTPALAASNVGATTATLTITGHSDAWHYKADTAPHTTCQGPVTAGTSTKDLTGLSANTSYTYEAYSDSTCTTANKIAEAAFTTGVSVSNLGEADYGSGNPIAATYAQEFTTGSAVGGWTLRSVTLDFVTAANPAVTVSIRARQSNGKPGATALATLTGTAANGETTFTCPSGCDLDASTPYFVHVSSSATGTHFIRTTQSKNQVLQPAANGWGIGDEVHHFTSGAWATYSTYVIQVGVEAVYAPGLTASAVTSSGATLTLSHYTGGDWYYKATSGPDDTCQGPVSGTSETLSGLTAGTSYTYTAYSDTTCTTANEIATAAGFAPATLAVSDVKATGATLTITWLSADWYYKANAAPDNTCQGPVAAGTSTKALTGLNANTTYTYEAFSDSGCTTANKLATAAAFTTPVGLTASNVAATTATLTIAGHSTDWHYKANTAPHTACQSAVSTSSTNLTGLSANTSYTYEAFSDSTCTTANKLATAAAFTTLVGLTASNVGQTTATLTIAGHTGDWYYDADTGPHTSCQGPVTANTSTKDITGLSANTTYTYEAYSASGCANADKLATAAAFTTPPGNPRSVSVANSTLTGQNRRYPVSWQKPAGAQASDTFAYQVQCTTVNDKTTTSWGACGTQNVSSTNNTSLSLTVSHSWSADLFRYVRVRTVKDSRNSDWVIGKTEYGS